jgi:hypothetical protein
MDTIMKKLAPVKPGQIRFTPLDNRLMESAPYVNTVVNPPSWFQRIGKHQGSIRKCAGTIDLLSAGVTLPMWTNYRFRPNPLGGWETAGDDFSPNAGINSIQGFPFGSTGQCPMTDIRKIEDGQYPKIINPWRFETAPGWSTLLLPLYWEPNENYSVVPAIVHTDFYHLMNIVLNLTGDSAFSIKYGTPIAQLIPFKRDSDFTEIEFNDESYFKYVATTGFGMGHIAPHDGTAGPYRRFKIQTDKGLSENPVSDSIIQKILQARKK